MEKRSLFFISDGTGITAETLGHSLLSQFENLQCDSTTLPYIDSLEKVQHAAHLITQAYEKDGQKPLVFATLVNKDIHARLLQAPCVLFDFFTPFIHRLEDELGMHSSPTAGRGHGVHNTHVYNARIAAINHTLSTDDGLNTTHYDHSDVILAGVSRCGKTPTCLYLAMQFGLRASNFPFTEEVLDSGKLPESLLRNINKVYGLTIQPEFLQRIRAERRGGRYATLAQCQHELDTVERIMRQNHIPLIDTTSRSIEEIATKVVADLGLKRQVV
jgi:[pyruvate, water dikinase]-phosphate phosphotransferase / [pyruvate, water dikinase] kinase